MTGSIPAGTLNNTPNVVNVNFVTPASLTAGTLYHYVVRFRQTGLVIFFYSGTAGNIYPGGRMNKSSDDGVTFVSFPDDNDLFFRDFYSSGTPAHNVSVAFDYQRRYL